LALGVTLYAQKLLSSYKENENKKRRDKKDGNEKFPMWFYVHPGVVWRLDRC